jgi:hypothetical protein
MASSQDLQSMLAILNSTFFIIESPPVDTFLTKNEAVSVA